MGLFTGREVAHPAPRSRTLMDAVRDDDSVWDLVAVAFNGCTRREAAARDGITIIAQMNPQGVLFDARAHRAGAEINKLRVD